VLRKQAIPIAGSSPAKLPRRYEVVVMMGLVWSLLGIVSGAFIALQAPINAALGRDLGLPIAATAASFIAGTALLIPISLAVSHMQGVPIRWTAPPMWLFWAGGCLGAAYVTSVIVLTPKLGAAATMAFVVAGQLIAGLLLDRMGAFELVVREITLGRIAGAVLLLVGALLIRFY
jgi:transporter family-2 protein